jgi:hexokinase
VSSFLKFPKIFLIVPLADSNASRNLFQGCVSSPVFDAVLCSHSSLDLGEITRNILLYLIDSNMLFSGRSTSEINKHYGLDTALMSAIESDQSTDLSIVRQTLINELKVEEKWIKQSDLEIVRWACQCVGTRAALLSGVAVAAVVKQTESKDGISVGIDGRYVLRWVRSNFVINRVQFVRVLPQL